MKKRIVVLILILMIFGFSLTLYLYTGLSVQVDSADLECEVFEECVLPDSAGSYRGESIDVKLVETVNNNLTGDYELKYTVQKYFVTKSKRQKLRVVDTRAPEIKLLGSIMLLVNKPEYEDPMYTVTDNYDSDVSVEVMAPEITTEGVYTIEYKATDSSGNISYKYRDIWYRKDFEDINVDSASFNLRDTSYAVNPREKPLRYVELTKYWFVGDSIIRNLGYTIDLPPESVLAYPALGPAKMDNPAATYINEDWDLSPYTLIDWHKPDRVVFNFGICPMETTRMDILLEQFETLFDSTDVFSNGVRMYMVSILPIRGNEAGTKPNNESINTMNYLLAELCEYRYIPFINVAEVLKDENGYGIAEYYENDGYHLNEKGQEVYVEYIKNYLGD